MKLSESELWNAVASEIKGNYNSNFQLDKVDWKTKVWLSVLIKKIDERLVQLETDLKERIII